MKRILAIAAAAVLLCSCGNRASLPYLFETVTIKGAVDTLVGQVERPAIKGDKAPVVILCHGLTGYRTENHMNAVNDSLVKHGFATVRFDFNGHGESNGKFENMTLQNELDDLHAIYEFTASRPWVDKKRIAVGGHSQGGLVSGVFAGDMGKEKVKCALLMSPAACIHTMVLDGEMFGQILGDIDSLPESIPFWGGRKIGRKYFQVARDMDVYGRTAAYDGHILIVQGDKDDPRLYQDSKAYCNYLKDVEYVELPGLTHCYPEDYATPAHVVAEFVEKNL